MKNFIKILPFFTLLILLIGCGTVANIKTTNLDINSQVFKNKTIYISDNYREIYWKDLSNHMIGTKPKDGETLEKGYDINKKILGEKGDLFVSFEKQRKTIPMLKMFKPKLENAITQAGGKIIADQKTANYTLSASITMGPTPAPAYASRNIAESMGKSLMTLGLAPTGYYHIKNDYKLSFSIKDAEGNKVSSKDYYVNNFVEQSVSDLSFSRVEVNTQTAIKLFENSLNEKISEFVASVKLH